MSNRNRDKQSEHPAGRPRIKYQPVVPPAGFPGSQRQHPRQKHPTSAPALTPNRARGRQPLPPPAPATTSRRLPGVCASTVGLPALSSAMVAIENVEVISWSRTGSSSPGIDCGDEKWPMAWQAALMNRLKPGLQERHCTLAIYLYRLYQLTAAHALNQWPCVHASPLTCKRVRVHDATGSFVTIRG